MYGLPVGSSTAVLPARSRTCIGSRAARQLLGDARMEAIMG